MYMLLGLVEAQTPVAQKMSYSDVCCQCTTEWSSLSFCVNRALYFLCDELNFAKIAWTSVSVQGARNCSGTFKQGMVCSSVREPCIPRCRQALCGPVGSHPWGDGPLFLSLCSRLFLSIFLFSPSISFLLLQRRQVVYLLWACEPWELLLSPLKAIPSLCPLRL